MAKENNLHKIKIKSGISGYSTSFFIDDKEIIGITNLKLDINIATVNKITFTIVPQEIEVDGVDANVEKLLEKDITSDFNTWSSETVDVDCDNIVFKDNTNFKKDKKDKKKTKIDFIDLDK